MRGRPNMYQRNERAGLFGANDTQVSLDSAMPIHVCLSDHVTPPVLSTSPGSDCFQENNQQHYAEQTRTMFEEDNDRQTEMLAEKVAALKNVR